MGGTVTTTEHLLLNFGHLGNCPPGIGPRLSPPACSTLDPASSTGAASNGVQGMLNTSRNSRSALSSRRR
jgi:hypothetical protein